MRTNIELSIGILERTALGCVAAFVGACVLCAGANFVKSSFGSGVAETMRRLGSSSDRMVKYLGPTFERINSLLETPENLGFPLYGDNVTYFGNERVVETALGRWKAEGGVAALHRDEILYTIDKLDTPRGKEIAPILVAVDRSAALNPTERNELVEAILLSPKVRTACGNPPETVLAEIARTYPPRQIARQLVADAGDIASIRSQPVATRVPTRRPTDAPRPTKSPVPTEPDALARLEEELGKWTRAGGMTMADVEKAAALVDEMKTLTGGQLADLVQRIDTSPRIPPDEKSSALTTLLLVHRVRACTQANAAQVRDIVTRIPRAVIIAKLETEPIANFHTLSLVRSDPITRTPTATATATSGATAPPVDTGKTLSYEDFLTMERNEALYRGCINTQSIVEKAFALFRESKLSPVEHLDLAELKEAGFLDTIPLCPSGGRYELDENETVRCTYHGSKTDPYEHHAFFQTVFRRYQLQQSAFEAGRYQEVKYQLSQVLKKYPNHLPAIELLGATHFALEEWEKAAQILYPVVKTYKGDAKTSFQTGFAFYGAGNDVLARDLLRQVLTATWASSSRRLTRRRQFYLLQDEARWILDRFVSPSSGKAVRFLEFQVAYRNRPQMPTEICESRSGEACKIVRTFVGGYYDTPTLRKLRKRLDETTAKLAALQPFEQDEIRRLEEMKGRIEQAIARASGGEHSGSLLRDLTAHLRKTPLEPCPEGGRYHVDDHGLFQCSHHPDLLTDASMPPVIVSASREERDALNRAFFFSALRGGDEKRFACIETNQRAILRALTDPKSGLNAADATVNLRDLHRKGLLTEAEITCPGGGSYVIEKRDGATILRCTVHGSHQDWYALPVRERR